MPKRRHIVLVENVDHCSIVTKGTKAGSVIYNWNSALKSFWVHWETERGTPLVHEENGRPPEAKEVEVVNDDAR